MIRDDADAAHPDAAELSNLDQSQVAQSPLQEKFSNAQTLYRVVGERIRERTGRDLFLAIGIGIVLGGIVLVSLIVVKQIFILLVVAAAVIATLELIRALQGKGYRLDIVPQVAVALGMTGSAYVLQAHWVWLGLFASLAVIAGWRLVTYLVRRETENGILSDLLVSLFVPTYISFLCCLALLLVRQDRGEFWVIAIVIITVASDTGAYAAGLSFGRTPMAPKVSPKKTWEGFAGGALAAGIAGVLVAWLLLGLPPWAGALIGAGVLFAATVGDLGESMLKRDLGVKDMSSWVPGHGGLLDRLDSVLPAIAVSPSLYWVFTGQPL